MSFHPDITPPMACPCSSTAATVDNIEQESMSIADQPTPSLPNATVHFLAVANRNARKQRMRADRYEHLVNKLLEFRRVRLEERAVNERMNRICLEKRRLKRILKHLRNIDDE